MSQITSSPALGLVLAGLLITIAGCGDKNPRAVINPDTGAHIDPNWATPAVHGASAKASKGFDSCRECHGTDLSGGISATTCLNTAGCHGAGVNAPHSPAPWRGGARTHTTTNTDNASVCALCHLERRTPPSYGTVPPGVQPGCFNNTLCHATPGHPAGWADPALHGADAKKAPSGTTGFSSCQPCHGTTFNGGTVQRTCLNTAGCHGANVFAPHSPAPWRGGARTHTTTDTGNAPVCALCHQSNPGTPGCFNNTLCHGQVGHPAGWADPAVHGATAKSAPTAATGFSSCQPCHGASFAGNTAVTCLNTAGCHGVNVFAPHSPAPWRGGARTHTTTNTGNAEVCALCHRNNNPGTPGCFNNTLCHAEAAAAPHAVPFTDPALHGPAAKADLIYCQSCHAVPATGGAGSNPRFNVPIGTLADGCESCHAAGTAHPVPWRGSLPSVLATAHVTAGNMANACALCHGAGLGGGAGPACSTCHTAGSPLTLTNCTSCHGRPPAGTTAPNREGAHSEHNALPKVVNTCASCHTNAGTATLNHDYAGGVVNVSFLTAYNGNAGTGTYSAATFSCSNVSCHGGPRTQTSTQAGQNPPQSTLVQTPSWLTGAIDVNTQCTACHVLGSAAGSPEDNSYYSGEHERHVYGESIACTTCHNTTSLAVNHFTNLDTAVMEGPASATLNSALQYSGGSCDPGNGGLNNCHGSKSWN